MCFWPALVCGWVNFPILWPHTPVQTKLKCPPPGFFNFTVLLLSIATTIFNSVCLEQRKYILVQYKTLNTLRRLLFIISFIVTTTGVYSLIKSSSLSQQSSTSFNFVIAFAFENSSLYIALSSVLIFDFEKRIFPDPTIINKEPSMALPDNYHSTSDNGRLDNRTCIYNFKFNHFSWPSTTAKTRACTLSTKCLLESHFS